MPSLPSVVEIILGILVLFGGGELFVAGSVALSLLLGIPQLVIGLTVVSLGTSAPELFVSLTSTLQGDADLAVSNVVGSNIFNILVVLGASAAIVPLRVRSRLVRRDVPLLLGISMAVWGMASAGRITWQAGVALLFALVAAYRGRADLAIGNVVGSNLLNQVVILGLCALVSGGRGLAVDPVMISRDLPIMVATTLACLPIFWTNGAISRLEGWLLLGLYGLYLVEQVLAATAGGEIFDNTYRFVVLVAVLPLLMVFLVWQVLRWKQQRKLLAAGIND